MIDTSTAHFALWDFKSILQISEPGAVSYITLALIWKAKQPWSWITNHSTQVKCSAAMTKVNERVTRNMILDTQSRNQQLNVQNSLGWDNTRIGFVFHLQDDSFINFSVQCFFLHLTRLMTSAALKSFLLWGLGIALNQHFHRDFQSPLPTKKTGGLLQGTSVQHSGRNTLCRIWLFWLSTSLPHPELYLLFFFIHCDLQLIWIGPEFSKTFLDLIPERKHSQFWAWLDEGKIQMLCQKRKWSFTQLCPECTGCCLVTQEPILNFIALF